MYPILFTIPFIDLPIYSYGVMLGLSLVVGWYLVMRLGGADGLPGDRMASCYIWTAVAAMIGARLLYIATNLHEFTSGGLMDLINVRKGGLVAYGGFLGGFAGSWLYLRRVKIRLLPWADVVVPTLATGLGITRIGCFLYGCDYGKPIPQDAPGWIKAVGLRFPNWDIHFAGMREKVSDGLTGSLASIEGAPAFQHHVRDHLVSAGAEYSALVYPTQLMEVANGWIAFAILMIARRRTRFRGQIFLIFTAYYGVTRALMEIIRGDTQRGGIWILSTSQVVGILTFAGAAVAWYFLSRRAKADPAGAMFLGEGAAPPTETEPEDHKVRKIKRKKKK